MKRKELTKTFMMISNRKHSLVPMFYIYKIPRLNIDVLIAVIWGLHGDINPLSAGDAFKRIHTVFPQLKFDRN